MGKKLTSSSGAWLLTGLVIGLGIAMFFQGQPTYATATDHSDDFSISTGHLTAELEAVYLLDFKTGTLLGSVMSRQTGKFQNFYRRELAADFGLAAKQKPKFIMVTGAMQSAQANVPINHALYVAELNTGKLCAYYMPYRGEMRSGSTTESLMPLDATQFRQGAVIRVQ